MMTDKMISVTPDKPVWKAGGNVAEVPMTLVASPRLASAFAGHGALPADARGARPEALQTRLAEEVRRWGDVLRTAAVYLD